MEQAEKSLNQHRGDPRLVARLGPVVCTPATVGQGAEHLDASISASPSHATYTARGSCPNLRQVSRDLSLLPGGDGFEDDRREIRCWIEGDMEDQVGILALILLFFRLDGVGGSGGAQMQRSAGQDHVARRRPARDPSRSCRLRRRAPRVSNWSRVQRAGRPSRPWCCVSRAMSLVVEVAVNGKPLNFIVDTGASAISLPRDFAYMANLFVQRTGQRCRPSVMPISVALGIIYATVSRFNLFPQCCLPSSAECK